MSEANHNCGATGATFCSHERTIQAALTRIAQLEKTDAIGRLAFGIVHDFNNIIGATRSFADFIAQAATPETDQYKYAARIMAISDRAAEMVGEIYTFANIKDVPRQSVRIGIILDEARDLLSGLMPAEVTLSVTDNATNAAIVANAHQIVRVLLNIAVNAGDAMAGRSGEVSISAAEVTAIMHELPQSPIWPDCAAGDFIFATGTLMRGISYVNLSVTDTGSGIPQHLAANIFEPFFTTKGKHRGSGLGLAVVRDVVAAHDGIIAVYSRIGEGTSFHVYLPAAGARARHARAVASCEVMTCPHGVDGCMERSPIMDDQVTRAEKAPPAGQVT